MFSYFEFARQYVLKGWQPEAKYGLADEHHDSKEELARRCVNIPAGFIDLATQRTTFFRCHPTRLARFVRRRIILSILAATLRGAGFTRTGAIRLLYLPLAATLLAMLQNLLKLDYARVFPQFLMLTRVGIRISDAHHQHERYTQGLEHNLHNSFSATLING
jgi:hypothetical protein